MRSSASRKDDKFDLVKVVVTGSAGSGKTALMNRFVKGAFPNVPLPTYGIDFGMKCYESQKLHLILWDTSGNERFRSLTSAYYRDTNIFIYTLDCSIPLNEQSADLVEKREQAETASPEAIHILVVTKSDLKRTITDEEILGFCRSSMRIEDGNLIVGFSAKQAQGVTQLNQLLFKTANGIVNSRMRQSRSRQRVKPVTVKESPIGELGSKQQCRQDIEDSFSKANAHFQRDEDEYGEDAAWFDHRSYSPVEETILDKRGQFQRKLDEVQEQLLDDFDKGRITSEEALTLAEKTEALAYKVANPDTSLEKAIADYRQIVTRGTKTSLLHKVIGGLIGAALGVMVGAIIGIGAGPGAAVTAFYGGVKGVVIGASVGGAALSIAGTWISIWHTSRRKAIMKHKLVELSDAAESVYRVGK